MPMTAQDKLIFFIDGASQGNPGPSGIGVVVCDQDGNPIDNISEYIGESTNNIAEYSALIVALEEGLVRKSNSIIVNTDSELLVKQLNGEYKVKNEDLKQLFNRVRRLLKGFKQVQINHIDRSKNKGADKLATKAVDTNRKQKPSSPQATFTFEN
jgi:ribonuclease HI